MGAVFIFKPVILFNFKLVLTAINYNVKNARERGFTCLKV
ncbi:hypothetical protein DCCM_3799 [Desulfocucumis palustris]|uniref:Uncharacterized protein n=1 Tax=Desulfocucumis palustris TaxID=1898651 RepID=A0A2L2XE88_9FIRM|nr:hypothetical protein DCCM_3799 [Desulfocucumis palustris]